MAQETQASSNSLAAVAAIQTFREEIRGKLALLLIDSEPLEAALIKGYSAKEDVCQLVEFSGKLFLSCGARSTSIVCRRTRTQPMSLQVLCADGSRSSPKRYSERSLRAWKVSHLMCPIGMEVRSLAYANAAPPAIGDSGRICEDRENFCSDPWSTPTLRSHEKVEATAGCSASESSDVDRRNIYIFFIIYLFFCTHAHIRTSIHIYI